MDRYCPVCALVVWQPEDSSSFMCPQGHRSVVDRVYGHLIWEQVAPVELPLPPADEPPFAPAPEAVEEAPAAPKAKAK